MVLLAGFTARLKVGICTLPLLLFLRRKFANTYTCAADPALRKQRKQKGGNTGKNFTEGWVEFEDKAVAKQVAAMLNSNPIGGKRRSAYHYDLWSLKYLPKFKWDHLTEEIGIQSVCPAVYTQLVCLIRPYITRSHHSALQQSIMAQFCSIFAQHMQSKNARCYKVHSLL